MLLSILLLSCALSIDALALAIAYGMRRIRVPIVSMLIIAFFSIFYAALAMFCGSWLALFLPDNIANLIGILILAIIGISIIWQGINSKSQTTNSNFECATEEISELKESKNIFDWTIKSLGLNLRLKRTAISNTSDITKKVGIAEATYLGFALSVDAIGVGFSSSMVGLSTMITPVAIGIVQLIFLCIGLFLGREIAGIKCINKKIITILPGFLILSIALMRILQ